MAAIPAARCVSRRSGRSSEPGCEAGTHPRDGQGYVCRQAHTLTGRARGRTHGDKGHGQKPVESACITPSQAPTKPGLCSHHADDEGPASSAQLGLWLPHKGCWEALRSSLTLGSLRLSKFAPGRFTAAQGRCLVLWLRVPLSLIEAAAATSLSLQLASVRLWLLCVRPP